MPADDKTLGLIACIALAQEEFGTLPKDSHATIRSDKGTYEYDYISEASLMARTREILSPLGVAVFVSCIDRQTQQSGSSTYVTVRITFAKGDEREAIEGQGEGLDPRDKGYNKAVTTAVRILLTKQFLQGGDIDPEQTVNERTTAVQRGATKLNRAQLDKVTKAALDNKITDQGGAIDQKLLLRLASYTLGEQVSRIDEIPSRIVDRLVDVMLPGYAANPATGETKMREMEVERGW